MKRSPCSVFAYLVTSLGSRSLLIGEKFLETLCALFLCVSYITFGATTIFVFLSLFLFVLLAIRYLAVLLAISAGTTTRIVDILWLSSWFLVLTNMQRRLDRAVITIITIFRVRLLFGRRFILFSFALAALELGLGRADADGPLTQRLLGGSEPQLGCFRAANA